MLMAIALVTLCVGLFSINYMEHYGAKANYYALLLMMMTGMNGLVLVTDLFGVYLFLEVAAIASYALVAYGLEHDELEAAFKYLMLSVIASAAVLLAIAVIFGMTGSTGFAGGGRRPAGLNAKRRRRILLRPVHHGLRPEGRPGPVPRLAARRPPFGPRPHLGHPVGPAHQGLGRLRHDPHLLQRLRPDARACSQILMYLGAVSIVVAALLALGQKDMKRMLAYSSISQVGYVVLGIGIGTPLGIAGGLFHLFNHALAKGLLFLNSGSVQQATGTRNLDEMGGLAKRMPLTAATNLVGALSIAGVPPLGGFWSKLLIIIALVQSRAMDPRRRRRPGQRPDALVLPDHPAQGLLRQARREVEGRQRSAVLDDAPRRSSWPFS